MRITELPTFPIAPGMIVHKRTDQEVQWLLDNGYFIAKTMRAQGDNDLCLRMAGTIYIIADISTDLAVKSVVATCDTISTVNMQLNMGLWYWYPAWQALPAVDLSLFQTTRVDTGQVAALLKDQQEVTPNATTTMAQ